MSAEYAPVKGGERAPLRTSLSSGAAAPALVGIRTIGKFGSFALIVNNISGPGMLDFPAAFQQGGYVVGIITILVVASLSAFIATMLCDVLVTLEEDDEATRAADGPATDPEQRGAVEFSGIFERIFGRRGFVATQWLYFLTLFTQNLGAIVATAQASDMLIATLFGQSVALRVGWPLPVVETWSALDECNDDDIDLICQPFRYADERENTARGTAPIVTLGYMLCLACLGPLGFVNLEENMIAQKISFVLLVGLCAHFLGVFYGRSGAAVVPAFGDCKRDVLGVVLYNFAFCVTVPSWVNEMKRDVDTRAVIWSGCLASAALYICVGWLGGTAYSPASANVLDELTSPSASTPTRVAGGIFAFAIIGLGIPVFSVMMRYNLVAGRICSNDVALVAGSVLPWALSWLFYQGDGIGAIFAWSGLIFNSVVDFILPTLAVLKRRSARHAGDFPPIPNSPRPLIVRPLPRAFMSHYSNVATAIVVFIVVFVVTDIGLKLASTFTGQA